MYAAIKIPNATLQTLVMVMVNGSPMTLSFVRDTPATTTQFGAWVHKWSHREGHAPRRILSPTIMTLQHHQLKSFSDVWWWM